MQGECCSERAEGDFRANVVPQELRVNAEGECCSARAQDEC